MAHQTFEDLQVWKRGCQQAVAICEAVAGMSNFALRDQIQRSAISVPSNIAEGHERDTDPDFVRFLRYAKGSNGELRTQIYIARKLGLMSTDEADSFIAETKEIGAMLQGLVFSITRSNPTSAED